MNIARGRMIVGTAIGSRKSTNRSGIEIKSMIFFEMPEKAEEQFDSAMHRAVKHVEYQGAILLFVWLNTSARSEANF